MGTTQPVDLNVGDTVVFGKYSSNTVKIGDEELLILNESEIFGVIEKTKKKKKKSISFRLQQSFRQDRNF